MVIVVVSRIGKLRGGALPMRMENQHWMRWHGIVGVVPSVCLLFTSICFYRGGGDSMRTETSGRSASAIRENGTRGEGKKGGGEGR